MCAQIPLGIVLAIPPFSYPVNLVVSKIAPILLLEIPLCLNHPPRYATVYRSHTCQ